MMRHKIITEDFEQIANSRLNFDNFKKKTVLITGASGMIGGYLTEFFLYLNETKKLKINVIGITRNKEKVRSRFSKYKGRHDLNLIIQDVSAPISLKGPADFIIHAASQASPKYFGADPVGTLLPNVIGTRNLLDIARVKKSEFLFISSGEVYGELKSNQIPTKESDWGRLDPTRIRSCYAESKRLGETMCMSWLEQYGVQIKIVRPFHVYGPGLELDDGRVFADFTKNIVEGHDIVLHTKGDAKRSFCYLADAICAFLYVINHGGNGEAYNVGNTNAEISVRKLAEKLVRLFPEKKLKVIVNEKNQRPGYIASSVLRSCPDTSKIEHLGWHPVHSLESGFLRTVQSFLF